MLSRFSRRFGSTLLKLVFYALFVLVCCEWAVYWIVLSQCDWPELQGEERNFARPLRSIILADTHLLGSKHGHWFDKLRREWQMRRTFQTAISLFKPDVVFILGDLFDEGDICDDEEWSYHVSRFESMFSVPQGTQLHVVMGNHDIGFHYKTELKPSLYKRFVKSFDVPSVRMLEIRGNVFVLVNSMAFEGDRCDMCLEAENELMKIAKKLTCQIQNSDHEKEICRPHSSSPILLQHFPLYRENEANCTSAMDSPPEGKRHIKHRPRIDVLSEEASTKLLTLLKPRLIIDGHTHYSCFVTHKDGTPEMTVPSFSWRNIINPSFLMAVITPEHYNLSKCFVPHEDSVIRFYMVSGCLFVIVNLYFLITHRRIKRLFSFIFTKFRG